LDLAKANYKRCFRHFEKKTDMAGEKKGTSVYSKWVRANMGGNLRTTVYWDLKSKNLRCALSWGTQTN